MISCFYSTNGQLSLRSCEVNHIISDGENFLCFLPRNPLAILYYGAAPFILRAAKIEDQLKTINADNELHKISLDEFLKRKAYEKTKL